MYTGKFWKVSTNKVFEVEAIFAPRPGFDIGLGFNFKSRKYDHAGFYLDLSLIWFWFSVSFYDTRHADERSGT